MTAGKDQSADRLLWLAGAVVVLMGLAWLVVEAPWSAPDPEALEALPVAPSAGAGPPIDPEPAPLGATAAVSDPLRMAQMALEAGMLTEPAQYSAWTLFGRIAAGEPDNAAARDGLEQVAAALLQRGNAALEQGRYDDASAAAATIAERFPDHAGARALAAEIAAATAPRPAPAPAGRASAAAASRPEPVAVAEAPAPRADPIPGMSQAFQRAMAQNAVLRPAGESAVDIVGEMLAIAPDHELTRAARDLLVTEMLDRSVQSIEALDTAAAQTWIDSAAPLAGDPAAVERAQERLTRFLIDAESQKMLPASELKQLQATPPEFPRTALDRGIEGWVELEFVVTPEGKTEDVTVIEASHDRYFREEAVAAVEDWRFEPVVFMGRPIRQRSYTRLEFVID